MPKEIVLAGKSLDHAMHAAHEGELCLARCQRRNFTPGSCASTQQDIDDLGLSMVRFYLPSEEPLDISVTSKSEMFQSEGLGHHLMPQRLPQGALVRAGGHVLMPSPEAYFVRRCADIHDIPECLALGMELTGRYSRETPGEHGEHCTYFCQPLTTARRIAGYVERAKGMRGAQYARQALPWLLDNSFSPMETLLATLLVLPPRHRGANLEPPQLNPEMPVPPELRHLTRRDTFKPDLYWPQYKLDVEYDSNERHSTPEERVMDDERKSDIESLRIRVIPMRTEDLTSRDAFERKLGQIVQHMADHGDAKSRRRLRRLHSRDALDAIDSLRRELLPPLEWLATGVGASPSEGTGYADIPAPDVDALLADPDVPYDLPPSPIDDLLGGPYFP